MNVQMPFPSAHRPDVPREIKMNTEYSIVYKNVLILLTYWRPCNLLFIINFYIFKTFR